MIRQQLRSLQDDYLVFRHVYPVIPPKVEYGLTVLGCRTIPVLEMMHTIDSDQEACIQINLIRRLCRELRRPRARHMMQVRPWNCLTPS
ncbi:winged helix-turn-helix transcriptional regulator [Candidatus Cryosericum hinesii]|uniref:winged helix-turn-helix transcriptional regulator n=1 Tax=Candidatus Cryosericum hinesii TaxID=2290915 RepID=UPI001A9DB261